MIAHRRLTRWTAALVLLAAPAFAQQSPSQQDHQQHHPGGSPPPAAAATPSDSRAAAGPQGGGMMGGPGMMMGGGGMMHGGGGAAMPMMMMGMADRMARHVEGRLAFLKTELKITDAQTPQWNAFAEAVRANAKAMKEMHPAAAPTRLPERVELHEKMLASHLDALRRVKAALLPLYAALSDEQKKTADELMTGPMGLMMM